MKEIICECGHGSNMHTETGCWFDVDFCLYCKCTKKKEDLYRERATTAERERDESRAQLATAQADTDAAIDTAEHYKHTFLGMQTEIDNLRSELERVKQERDAAREFLAKIISMEENNGVLNGVWINLENARKASGLVEQ